MCTSTVRRYTGYFKEEQYALSLKEGRLKVGKVKLERPEGKTELQAELFGGLGFKAEKNEETRQMQKELREMIFPHLRAQNKGNNCEPATCSASGCEKASCECG